MKKLTLGLDVGTQSIGWAVLDEHHHEIVATGVRIFPEGVDRDQQGGEKSKSQSRREARGIRRQIARRRRRLALLRASLYQAGLVPEGAIHFGDRRWVRRWIAAGRLPEAALQPPDSEARREFDSLDPYELRRRGLDEPLTLHEFGRVLLHLAQRRGYLSNRKTDRSSNETKGILAEMGRLAEEMQTAGSRTLGEHFAGKLEDLSPEHLCGDLAAEESHRVRRRHTRRDMYLAEFEQLWQAQQKHHPEVLTDRLKYGASGPQTFPKGRSQESVDGESPLEKYGLHGLIFFQRKMYWPRSVIGRCELERGEKRCPRADRLAQQFRIWQEVNNLRYVDAESGSECSLDDAQRQTVVDALRSTKQQTFAAIKKKLGLPEATRFNLERGERDKLQGDETEALLKSNKGVGKRWKTFDETTKDQIVRILIEEDQEADALRRLQDECRLTPEEATRCVALNLPDGYVSYSRKAISKLLPHLQRGLHLMGNDASDSALHAAGYLRPDERVIRASRTLPSPPDLPNPIVRQALVEVRKVVNAILREYVLRQGHVLETIRVELAREAKQSFQQRQETLRRNRQNERRRKQAKEAIDELGGVKPTRAAINRYLLWQEQEEDCLYCGRKISLAQLFNGEADVDHILPRWRSLDDSMANKVVCHRTCNQEKGDRTPAEWLRGDSERWKTMMQVARRLDPSRQRKLIAEDIELDDFVHRQLTDTAYISRCVREYLERLGRPVQVVRGQLTADLRHWWGLNNILDPEGRGQKNRADHRHHAIDALVIGLMTPSRLKAAAEDRGSQVRPPWPDFRTQAEESILSINVSHRPRSGIHGALHNETFYGATQKRAAGDRLPSEERPWARDWIEDEKTVVRRKKVTDITTTSQLEKVRDATIRELLRAHLRERIGIDPDRSQKIPAEAFRGDNVPRMPSGVPILKVRMLEQGDTFRPVSETRRFQYVKPDSNHHIVYRATGEGEAEKWTAEVVTMWDAARRARQQQPLIDRSDTPKGRFVMSLTIGEMFEIDGEGGERLLCVVRQVDQRSRRVYYKLHHDARPSGELKRENLYLSPGAFQQRHPTKVTVDLLGRVRTAND